MKADLRHPAHPPVHGVSAGDRPRAAYCRRLPTSSLSIRTAARRHVQSPQQNNAVRTQLDTHLVSHVHLHVATQQMRDDGLVTIAAREHERCLPVLRREEYIRCIDYTGDIDDRGSLTVSRKSSCAWCLSNKSAAAPLPLSAARRSAVMPFCPSGDTKQPLVSSTQLPHWLFHIAQISRLLTLTKSTSAPWSSNSWITAVRPFSTANISAVIPAYRQQYRTVTS